MANHLGRAQLTNRAPPPLSPSPLHCFLVDFGLSCAWNSPEIDVVYLLGAVEKLPSCTVAVALPATNLQAGGGGGRQCATKQGA